MADHGSLSLVDNSDLDHLVPVLSELSKARDIGGASAIILHAARALTGADGASLVLRQGEQSPGADENADAPLWQGQRFPLCAGISGWVMDHAEPAIIEDITADARVPAGFYAQTSVKSLAVVPIPGDVPAGAISLYWSLRHAPASRELTVLKALAGAMSLAIKNLLLSGSLRQSARVLERQQTRLQSQDATLDVFKRALAHDLREPVRTLVSYSGLLRDEPDDPENNANYVTFIHKAARRMDMLLDSVSRYARIEDGAEPVRSGCDLNEIAATVQRNLAALFEERGTNFEFEALPLLHANAGHLTQLLQNLIGNAVLHNPDPVTITLRHAIGDGFVAFSVADDGIGFSPSQAEIVFEPFRRLTHLAGCSGMGLPICRRIVSLYGGEIRCDSTPGQGAVFTFTLPATELAHRDFAAASRD